MNTLDQLQRRREQAISDGERAGVDAVVDDLAHSDTIRTPGGLMRDLSRPRGSMQSWREVLYTITADGVAVVTPAVATILVPDFSLPANYLYPGRTLKYKLLGRQSTVITTPGTYTWALRYGGVGGTVLATSAALAPDPTAASTAVPWALEFWTVCRSVGSSGSMFTMGRINHSDIDDATVATLKADLDSDLFPASAAAVTINTTTANALSPCVTPSVTTGSITCHIAILEALT
jgi:hypothetical protein